MTHMTFQDWVGLVTVVFLAGSFVHRMGLARRSDVESLKGTLEKVLEEARATNGRVSAIESWRQYHERWKEDQIREIKADLQRVTDEIKSGEGSGSYRWRRHGEEHDTK